MTYFKTRKDPVSGKRIRNRRGDTTDMLIVENVIPPIIDKKTFYKAQEILAMRRRSGRTLTNTKNNNLLIGLVYCGECGAPMNVNTRKNNAGYYYGTYRCNNKKKKGSNCINSEISMEHLQRYVILNLMDFLKKPESIAEIQLGIKERYRKDMCQSRDNIEHFKNEIKKLEVRKHTLIERISEAPSNIIKLLYEDLESISLKQETLQENIDELSSDNIEFSITAEEVESELKKVQEYMLSEKSELIKEVIQSFIERINIYKDTVEIIYSLNRFYCSHKEVFRYSISRKELLKCKGISPNLTKNEIQKQLLLDSKNSNLYRMLQIVNMKEYLNDEYNINTIPQINTP